METIKNYLDTMFLHLPETPEVLRAKTELWQMMEDKYTELIENGMRENEAVGTVISEFGNLDELAESLGIGDLMARNGDPGRENAQGAASAGSGTFADAGPAPQGGASAVPPRFVAEAEARGFVFDRIRASVLRGIAVFLFIICACGVIWGGIMEDDYVIRGGMVFLFGAIAAGVSLSIFSNVPLQKWRWLDRDSCALDPEAERFVRERLERDAVRYALLTAAGTILCIVSVVPVIILGVTDQDEGFPLMLAVNAILFLIGLGVLIFIISSGRKAAFLRLQGLRGQGADGGARRQKEKDVRYANKTLAAVMSVYWPTVTCIYLIWSFLTFHWGITWIIWPVAGILESAIKRTAAQEGAEG